MKFVVWSARRAPGFTARAADGQVEIGRPAVRLRGVLQLRRALRARPLRRRAEPIWGPAGERPAGLAQVPTTARLELLDLHEYE